MYTPRPFAVDADARRAMLADVVVGHLVTATAAGPMATTVPWVVDLDVGDAGVLLGHIARGNPQWSTPWLGEALVLVAGGPDGYISPSWYAAKREHGRVVPTWDYASLQVFGHLSVHDDVDVVSGVVRRLTDRHESSRASAWSVDDAPVDYLDGQLRAIIAVELRVTRVEASVKMSQNRSAADVAGVVDGLRSDGRGDLADAVRRANP